MNEVRSFLLRHKNWAVFVVLMVAGYAVTSLAVAPPQSGGGNVISPRQTSPSSELVYPPLEDDMTPKQEARPDVPIDADKEPDPVTVRSYSIPLPELSGLPSDLAPGTPVELWVAWERPFTRGPRVQRLLRDATFERIAPPATAEGMPVAVLSVPSPRLPDVIFADKWGSISVASH